MTRSTRSRRKHSGRVTLGPCAVLGDDRYCEPLNRIWIVGLDQKVRSYASCTCGRRFKLGRRATLAEDVERWRGDVLVRSAVSEEQAKKIVDGLWPPERESRFARPGIVPVGTPVLHSPTDYLANMQGPSVASMKARLLASMAAAQGIGLAANQVGASLRMLAHNLGRVAPQVFVNPVVLGVSGLWSYDEGCLSLHVENTRCRVDRPKRIDVVAGLPAGEIIVVEADELLSRVLQHELDHLDGIEYVQRLDAGRQRDRVYDAMGKAGVDVSWLPFRPYSSSSPKPHGSTAGE